MAAGDVVSGIGPQVSGLGPALHLLLRTAAPAGNNDAVEDRRRVVRASLLPLVVKDVKVRDAGRFLQLAKIPLAGPAFHVNRVLPNSHAIRMVADVADLLLLLVDPVLPELRRLPTDSKLLRVADASAFNIAAFGAAAGGSLRSAAREFSDALTNFTAAARAHPQYSPHAALVAEADELIRRAKRLLDTTVTVRQPSHQECQAAAEAVAHSAAAAEEQLMAAAAAAEEEEEPLVAAE